AGGVERFGEFLARCRAAGGGALLFLRAVSGVGDVAQQLPAAVGFGHVVDADHDGVRLRPLDLLAGERVGHHGYIRRDAAFQRAFGARRRMRVSRQGSASEERCHYRFQIHFSKKRGARFPGRRVHLRYCALPVPLLEPLVAVSLEGAVRGEASPGPAVVPVLPRAAGAAVPEGAVVAPPLAAPARWYASHSEREIMPSPFLSIAEKSALPRLALLDVVLPVDGLRSAVGALGSPAERGLATPPVGPVPVLLAPEGGA